MATPRPIELPPDIRVASVHVSIEQTASDANSFSMLLTQQGEVYSWGAGYMGQLGLGDSHPRLTPSRVTGWPSQGVRVLQLACGEHFTFALAHSGEVYSWGESHSGEAGRHVAQPVRMAGFEGEVIVSLTAGQASIMAVSSEGTLFGWTVGGDLSFLSVFAEEQRPTRVFSRRSGVTVRYAALGQLSEVAGAISRSGELYTWGEASWGLLGHPHLMENGGMEGFRPRTLPEPKRVEYLPSAALQVGCRGGEGSVGLGYPVPPLFGLVSVIESHEDVGLITSVRIRRSLLTLHHFAARA